MEPYEDIAGLFKALAHPTRLAILHALAQGETCVCHLTALLRRRQPYISQQLMILRDAGLVSDRREGLMVYYRLSDARLAELIERAAEVARPQGEPVGLPEMISGPIAGCSCPQCVAYFAAQSTV